MSTSSPTPERPAGRLVHLDDVLAITQNSEAGWNISQFRVPISGADGSTSAVFHGRFNPGSQHDQHRHTRSAEMCIYLRGRGSVGTGPDRLQVGAGDARVIPRGVDHFFHNVSEGEAAEVIGLYVGATSVEASGYVFAGVPTARDLERCLEEGSLLYPVARSRDVEPDPDAQRFGWCQTDYRRLLVSEETPGAYSFLASVSPGGGRTTSVSHPSEIVYFVCDGSGHLRLGDEISALRAGHMVYVPVGVESSLWTDSGVALELAGFEIG